MFHKFNIIYGIIQRFFHLLRLIDSFYLGIKTVETVNK
jgi:hypothetical protein